MRGVITWYNEAKGYGFLRVEGDATNRDVFVHYTAIDGEGYKTLVEGETVEFDIVESPKGPQALRVRRGSDPLNSIDVGTKLYCNGYPGTVVLIHSGQLSGMCDVRLASGTVCVSISELIRFRDVSAESKECPVYIPF